MTKRSLLLRMIWRTAGMPLGMMNLKIWTLNHLIWTSSTAISEVIPLATASLSCDADRRVNSHIPSASGDLPSPAIGSSLSPQRGLQVLQYY